MVGCKRCPLPDSLVALAAFAETLGVVVVPSPIGTPVITTDGRVVFVFIPVSATPAEQGRILAELLKGTIERRRAA